MYSQEALDDMIDFWHRGDGYNQELHDYLGWTWEEYKRWVATNEQPKR